MRTSDTQRRLFTGLLIVAVLVAPFLALLFRLEAGLLVTAVALVATAMLLHGAVGHAPANARRFLWVVVAINLTLAAASLAILAIRLAGR